ncbi:MAG: DUF4364 family protein [Eubacterium sp.]|nr:DUF4364 family protein [Eubacterium sp.]
MYMEGLMLYKLIILYMLDRIDEYTLTNSRITSFILDKGYTNLFNIHESLSELIDEGFISVSIIRDTKHYKITNLGEEALLYFENRLSNSIKQEILDYFKAEKINLKNESEIYADFYYNDNQEYTVECVIKERRDTLIDLKLNVTSKTLARSICDNWRAKSTDVYQYLINELWVNSDNENTEPTTTDILKSKTPPAESPQ